METRLCATLPMTSVVVDRVYLSRWSVVLVTRRIAPTRRHVPIYPTCLQVIGNIVRANLYSSACDVRRVRLELIKERCSNDYM